MDILMDILKDPRIVYLIIIVAIILQIFLSKTKNKKLGLIMPWLSFIIAVSIFIGMGFTEFSFKNEPFIFLFRLILVLNMPTIVLMIIYVIFRKARKINENFPK